MVVETLYIGRNNTFSLQLLRAGDPVNLMSVTTYELHLPGVEVFGNQDLFLEKDDGVVEISIGNLLTEDHLGNHRAYLVTFDPVNNQGVRWPNFKLKVLE